jgi:hypothetical protein
MAPYQQVGMMQPAAWALPLTRQYSNLYLIRNERHGSLSPMTSMSIETLLLGRLYLGNLALHA